MEEKKIGFIGDATSVEFFKVFGTDIFGVHTVEEAEKVIRNLKLSDYATIFITEEVFDRERFQRYLMDKKLLVIPSLKSKEGKGYHIVEELIRKATGMKENG
jgi:vacuolar-type H+-ATPase subunit F/Vma7